MTRMNTTAMSALALVLAAGAATGQTGVRETDRENQTRQQTRQPGATPERQTQRPQNRAYGQQANYSGPIHLMEAEDLLGVEITGGEGEEFGSIEEMIIDRGNGEIRFVILRVNSVLGFGGDHIALPYHQLRWSESEEGFRTTMTQTEVKRQSNILPDDWKDMNNGHWMNQIDPRAEQHQADPRTSEAMRSGKKTEFTGRIGNVTRRVELTTNGQGDEQVILEILAEGGETREVILGPSWYVMGQDNSPFRGQPVVVRGVEHEGRFIASAVTIDGKNIELRREDGSDAWSDSGASRDTPERNNRSRTDRPQGDRTDRPDRGNRTGEPMTDAQREAERSVLDNTERRENYIRRDGAQRTGLAGRYFLLSDLDDAKAQARRASSGEIESVVIEVNSGKIAFLLFDPNENFLGIGDDEIPVPWSVVSFGHNKTVNIDADAETVGRVAEMPDDLSELRNTNMLAPIYQAYGSQMPDFRPASDRQQGREGMNRPGDAGRDDLRPTRPGERPTRPGERPTRPADRP